MGFHVLPLSAYLSRLPPNFPLFINSRVSGHQNWTPDSGERIYLLILKFPVRIAYHIFALYPPTMLSCSQLPQAARPSSCSASSAATTFHPVSGHFRSNPSPSSAPFASKYAGTCPPRSSSVGLTASSPGTSGQEAGSGSEAERRPLASYRKNRLGLVTKKSLQTAPYIRILPVCPRRSDSPNRSLLQKAVQVLLPIACMDFFSMSKYGSILNQIGRTLLDSLIAKMERT